MQASPQPFTRLGQSGSTRTGRRSTGRPTHPDQRSGKFSRIPPKALMVSCSWKISESRPVDSGHVSGSPLSNPSIFRTLPYTLQSSSAEFKAEIDHHFDRCLATLAGNSRRKGNVWRQRSDDLCNLRWCFLPGHGSRRRWWRRYRLRGSSIPNPLLQQNHSCPPTR